MELRNSDDRKKYKVILQIMRECKKLKASGYDLSTIQLTMEKDV